MDNVHYRRARLRYFLERRRERERRRQWDAFIQTEGPRYVVVNWVVGGKCGIALCIEAETDRLDLALSKREIVAATHSLKDRSTAALIYDRVDKKVLHLVGGTPYNI